MHNRRRQWYGRDNGRRHKLGRNRDRRCYRLRGHHWLYNGLGLDNRQHRFGNGWCHRLGRGGLGDGRGLWLRRRHWLRNRRRYGFGCDNGRRRRLGRGRDRR